MAVDAISWGLLMGGAFFCLVGGVGLLRLPEFYTRLHAAGITDTLGAALVLSGLMLQAGSWLVAAKLALILGMLWLTSPTSSHAIAKAARMSGLRALLEEDENTEVTA
ncbi:MAG: monovalent cation/H(+) antiporter subunit G [Gemmatimonadota bacterium]